MNFNQLGLVLLGVALGSLAWSKVGIAIFGGLAFLLLLPRAWQNPGLFRTSFLFPFCCLVVAILLSSLFAPETAEPLEKMDGLWPLLFLFLTAGAVRSCKNPLGFLHAFILLASLGGAYSIAMALGLAPPHSDYSHLNIGPTHLMGFSVAMTTALPITTDLALRTSGRGKVACFFGVGLILFGLISTEQRANMLVGCFLTSLLFLLHYRLTPKAILSTSVCLLLIPLLLWLGGGRLAALLELISQEGFWRVHDEIRFRHWQVAWDAWLDSPIWGHGFGTYSQLAVDHPIHGSTLFPFVQAGHFSAHSFPLHVLATQGLLGLAVFGWFALALILPFFKGFSTNHHASVLGLIAWFILAGTSITDTPIFQSVRLAAFTLLSGFAYGFLMRSKEGAASK